MMNTGVQERARSMILFPPFYPRCRHCVIRNGIPYCGLFHDMSQCSRNCPYAEVAPIRLPGRTRVSFGILGC
ncbi:MAG: hypothetical protein J6I76_16265 [Oribacterium sp.]|nr:hypothetical protein [Lachnospiraceae bacterium]MBP3805413.1 hypothetical protein [Oribacterium sp.]